MKITRLAVPNLNRVYVVLLLLSGFVAVCLRPSSANAQATNRSIEEFVEAQGEFCLSPDLLGLGLPPPDCVVFTPPVENQSGWADNGFTLFSIVDYAGLAEEAIQELTDGAVSFGTEFAGSVIERPLADGRTQVEVRLHTTNALTWVSDTDFATTLPDLGDFPNFASGNLLFGHRVIDIAEDPDNVVPSLGDSLLRVTFITTAPGEPLPDLMQLTFGPEEGQEITFLGFRAQAAGQLREAFGVPDGTPGRFTTIQNGLNGVPAGGPQWDGFPVESMILKETGGGSLRSIPEPSSVLLAAVGLLCMVGFRWRRHKA